MWQLESTMILVNGLGLALSRRNPNNSAELDPVLYAMHILSICVIFGAIILDFKHSRSQYLMTIVEIFHHEHHRKGMTEFRHVKCQHDGLNLC